jgi:hypothetical protein
LILGLISALWHFPTGLIVGSASYFHSVMGLLLFTAGAICMNSNHDSGSPYQNERSTRDGVSLDYHAVGNNIRNHLSACPTTTGLGACVRASSRHTGCNRDL